MTGTPLLALNSGGNASYSSGSGTSTLTFTYTVANGQNSPHLDYTSTGALTLNGGTIKDVVNNAANLNLPSPGAAGSLGANKSIVINNVAPRRASLPSRPSGVRAARSHSKPPPMACGCCPPAATPICPGSASIKLSITLSQAANLSLGDVTITGLRVANYGPVTISGSGTTYTINFAQPINAADRVTITIANASIATYTRRIDVLPGDFNDDGLVTSIDMTGRQ